MSLLTSLSYQLPKARGSYHAPISTSIAQLVSWHIEHISNDFITCLVRPTRRPETPLFKLERVQFPHKPYVNTGECIDSESH